MYKQSIQIFALVLLFGFTMVSCNNSSKEDVANGQSEEDITQSDQQTVKCKLQSQSFVLADKQRTFNLTWDDNNVSRIDAEIVDQEGVFMEFEYNENNQIVKLSSHFGERISILNYTYEEGVLIQIEGDGFLPRVFEYNDKGQIISETRKMPNGEDHIIQYTYENGLPIESLEIDKTGEVAKSNKFKYDENPNPLVNLSVSLNSMEMIFGYAVGNALHNVIAVETTYHIPSKWEKKDEGEIENKEFTYEYNEHNYPVAMPGDNDVKYSYVCE